MMGRCSTSPAVLLAVMPSTPEFGRCAALGRRCILGPLSAGAARRWTVFGATSEKPEAVSRKSSDTAATHAICTESGKHVERCCSFGDYDSRKPNCESAQNVRGDMAGGDGGSGTMAAPVRVWRWVQASLPALSNAPESTVQTVLVKTFR